jgi:hypothetical protein
MSTPPQSSKEDTTTRRTVIKTDSGKGGKSSEEINAVVIKAFRISLTLFYGQFVANGIYDNLIRTIPYLVDSQSAYSIIKVVIGVLIIALTVFAMVSIWIRQRILIFVSAILLIVLSIASLIISIIDIVQKKERNSINEKEFAADICELCVQAVFRIGAVALKFVMIRFLKAPPEYTAVPTRA